MRKIRWLGFLVAGVLLLLASTPEAFAIPAFARKYETSCQTCHIAYPKLNTFGQAFRLRGYRMPGETEEMVKQEPVALGTEGYKRVFPKAVWPADIPANVPLSLDVQAANVTTHHAEDGETNSNDFLFPESIALLAGGTIGDNVSFFAEVEAEEEIEHGETHTEIAIGHAELHFNGPWGTGTNLNAKIGRVVPEVTQPFFHGAVLISAVPASIFGFNPIGFHGSDEVGGGGHHGGGGAIAVPTVVDGVEVYGIVNHRFQYSAGFANGIGPGDETRDGNESKDLFGQLAYKIGGLALDGEGYQQSEKNWRERSVQFGVFAYEGDGGGVLFEGTGHHAGSFVEDREFTRYGASVNAFIDDVNIIGGWVSGEDTLAEYEDIAGVLVLDEVEDFEYEAWFAETDVVFLPWLHLGVRYEWLEPSRPNADDFERATANLTALVRANLKFLLEYDTDIGGANEDNYRFRAAIGWAM